MKFLLFGDVKLENYDETPSMRLTMSNEIDYCLNCNIELYVVRAMLHMLKRGSILDKIRLKQTEYDSKFNFHLFSLVQSSRNIVVIY